MSAVLAACAGNANETTTPGSMTPVGGAAGADNSPGRAGGGMASILAGAGGALAGSAGLAEFSGAAGAAGTAPGGSSAQSGAPGQSGAGGGDPSLNQLAAPFDQLRLDLPCDHYQDQPCEPQNSGMPERGYLCCYVDETIERKNRPHVDTELAFGGDPNRTYDVALRVRGVVENRDYMSQGKKVGAWLLEQSGTELPKPGAIHVFGFTVRDPEKTFYFNSWNDVTTPARLVAVDYQATLPIRGGSKVRVFEYDDIGKIWANAAKLTVPELPPYPEAVEGQYLHFDVLSVTPRP